MLGLSKQASVSLPSQGSTHPLHELLIFGINQVKSCAFAGPFLLVLAISSHLSVAGTSHYDLIFVCAILIQAALVATKLETVREVLVLSAFHFLGMMLELYKTSPAIHAWSYPEACFFRIGTVPLYSGFMYASVASYIMQAWRIFDLKIDRLPSQLTASALCAAIYANFFTERTLGDARWWLFGLLLLTFRHTSVQFTVLDNQPPRKMPLLAAFGLIGSFIWLAENFATYFGAWVYPDQRHGWTIVHVEKVTSWTLLVIISLIIVALLKKAFPKEAADR